MIIAIGRVTFAQFGITHSSPHQFWRQIEKKRRAAQNLMEKLDYFDTAGKMGRRYSKAPLIPGLYG